MQSFWVSGSTWVSIDVDDRLLSHVEPNYLGLLFIRTFRYLSQNILETCLGWLGRTKDRKVSDLSKVGGSFNFSFLGQAVNILKVINFRLVVSQVDAWVSLSMICYYGNDNLLHAGSN